MPQQGGQTGVKSLVWLGSRRGQFPHPITKKPICRERQQAPKRGERGARVPGPACVSANAVSSCSRQRTGPRRSRSRRTDEVEMTSQPNATRLRRMVLQAHRNPDCCATMASSLVSVGSLRGPPTRRTRISRRSPKRIAIQRSHRGGVAACGPALGRGPRPSHGCQFCSNLGQAKVSRTRARA